MANSKTERRKTTEIRFFLSPGSAKKLMKDLKDRGFKSQPYSFTDYFFSKGTNSAKIRRWFVGKGGIGIELQLSSRKNGLKSETNSKLSSIKEGYDILEKKGFDFFTKTPRRDGTYNTKEGEPSYSIDLFRGFGWTAEVDIPVKLNKKTKEYVKHLKSLGAKGFTTKSTLELLKEKEKKSQ